MPITATLELKHKPESVPAARNVMRRALHDTRAFDANLGTDVLVDQDDQAHWIIYERWETVEHDEAYRSFRAGEGQLTELPRIRLARFAAAGMQGVSRYARRNAPTADRTPTTV